MAATAWNNAYAVELRKCRACAFVYSAAADMTYEEFFIEGFGGKDRRELLSLAHAEGLDDMVGEIVDRTDLRRGASVLDFGAGIGLTSLTLIEQGFDVIAVEQSERFREVHQRLGVTTFGSTDEALRARGSFDLVVMKDVLEHLPDPVPALTEVV